MNPSLIECIFGDQILKCQSLRAPRNEVQVKSLGSRQAGSKEEVGGGSQHGALGLSGPGEVSGYNERRNTLSQILYFLPTALYTTIMLSGSEHHHFYLA